jgi:restriction endonuclease S subunit
MLKINGKCVVVLPDGQDLFSKTNTSLVAIREYLVKTCDLKEIIYLPSGIFTYTSIKTCVFYFVKKIEGTEVLETKIKFSKTQKEISREYIFSKTHQTTTVKFYNYNFNGDVKNLLVEVPIEKFASNSYSLNYAEYMKDETVEEQYEDGVVVRTLGEVCSIIKGEKKRSKDGKENGLYPLYYCSILGNLYLDTFDYTGEGIIINKTNGSGKAMVYFGNNKYNVGETTIHFKSKINELQTKYVYYYLFHNIKLLQKYFKGANQKSIVEDDLFKIKIPIPTLEHQKEIVKYLDFIYEKANKTSNDKIAELKQLNGFCLSNQKIFGENEIKTLGEVCDKIISGKFNSKDSNSIGKYPFYTNKANNPDGFCDNYCFDYNKYFILIKDGGAGNNKYGEHIGLGKIFKVYGKSGGTSHQYALVPKNDYEFEYLYYYLKFIKNEIMDLAHYTTGLGCIKKGDIEGLKIVIPSLERQKEIVEYCEYNDILIKQLEKEIENNKKQAQQFITGIVKKQVQKEQDETSTVNSELIDEVQDEIAFTEQVIEPKPKVKKIVKKAKKSTVIAETN